MWFLLLFVFEIFAILSGVGDILNPENPLTKLIQPFSESFIGSIVAQVLVYLIFLVYILLVVLPLWALLNIILQAYLWISSGTLQGRFRSWVAVPALLIELAVLSILVINFSH